MAHRPRLAQASLFLAAAAAASIAMIAGPVPASAQVAEDQPIKEVENSKFSTSGIITSNAVYIRCGPGDNYYPTMKIDKGAKVTVVGAKFDWLKVVPPEGSFCYVARLYIERHGDGKVGRVTKDAINVRAGSSLSALKIGILCELSQGEEVEILGEEQEYFKIKPPAKAYLYVSKKFVEPDPDAKPVVAAKPEAVKPEAVKVAEGPKVESPDFPPADPPKPEVAVGTNPPKVDAPAPEAPVNPNPPADAVKPEAVKPEAVKPDAARPDPTNPAPEIGLHKDTVPNDPPVTEGPKPETVKPEVVKPEAVKPEEPKVEALTTPEAAEAAYDKAEAAYAAARALPTDQQPLAEMVRQFEALSKSDALPESMRRVAESRLAGLKGRLVAQAELAKLKSAETNYKQKQLALAAEQEELQKRIAENTVKFYAAVGTLQPSSLQMGQGTLYRITDPATGRTVCYVRSADAKTANQVGQFVGVKGAIQEEKRLGGRVITPTEIVACDPTKVHQSISAQIIPPSLIPRGPVQAGTDLRQP